MVEHVVEPPAASNADLISAYSAAARHRRLAQTSEEHTNLLFYSSNLTTMSFLAQFLPLSFPEQSPDWEWEERDEDSVLLPIAFNDSINERDKFLGQKRCVICGVASDMVLQHCHIVDGGYDGIVKSKIYWILASLGANGDIVD